MKQTSSYVFSFFLLVIVVGTTFSQTDNIRTQRLVGLAKVWNTVKYFHPYLAEKDIDWDKALVESIPKVNAARSPEEYARAVNSMLAALGDPVTSATITENKTVITNDSASTSLDPVTISDGVITINVVTAAAQVIADQTKRGSLPAKISPLFSNAKGIILDFRGSRPIVPDGDDTEYFLEEILQSILPLIVKGSITLGTAQYRTHNGYRPQAGTTSGGYYSSIATDVPDVIIGHAEKALPIAVLINTNSPDQSSLWAGLRSAGNAVIIQDGRIEREFGSDTAPIKVTDNVVATIRITEFTGPDGAVGIRPDRVVANGEADGAKIAALAYIGSPHPLVNQGVVAPKAQLRDVSRDEPYREMSFPRSEYRLLALFRFWGVIDTFYPYKDLIADTWSSVLPRFIPKFEASQNALEYQTAIFELVTEIHDSHGFITGAKVFDESFGTFVPPVLVRYIEDQAVIVSVLDDKVQLKPGDVIEKVDGKSEREIRDRIGELYAASTPQAMLAAAGFGLLRGAKDSVAHLVVHTGKQKPRTVDVSRSLFRYDAKIFDGLERKTPVFQVLPSGFGYVDLARLQVAGVDDMFKSIMPTKGVIFDMRGYPNGTAWQIAPRLTDKNNVAAALFSRPIVSARNLTDPDIGNAQFTFRQPLPTRNGDVYRGKVVMLIDENAISQSEHTCLFFESATNVTFIGTPTMGANGDVTNLVLPGGIYVYFTGQAVRHIDGRQLQRLGIQPTIKVAPTIAGVASGRDEILEAAIKYLRNTAK